MNVDILYVKIKEPIHGGYCIPAVSSSSSQPLAQFDCLVIVAVAVKVPLGTPATAFFLVSDHHSFSLTNFSASFYCVHFCDHIPNEEVNNATYVSQLKKNVNI